MIKFFLIIGLFIMLFSCNFLKNNNSEIEKYEAKIDSLQKVIKSFSFAPSIFDAQCGKCFEGDTLLFDVGIIYDNSAIIDTISLSLLKYDKVIDEYSKFEGHDILITPKSKSSPSYLTTFSLVGIPKGQYLYTGYIVYNGRSDKIMREINIE